MHVKVPTSDFLDQGDTWIPGGMSVQCIKPIWLNQYKIMVPCGHCRMCKIARSREWATRINHELRRFPNSCYVTLTYNNDHFPTTGSLSKTTLQRFFKRLRWRLKERELKYYASGEYGGRQRYRHKGEVRYATERPHYHAIILGTGLADHKVQWDFRNNTYRCLSGPINDAWKWGFISIDEVTYQSARYVADYIWKAYNGKMVKKTYGDRLQPFQVQSQGLGKQWVLDNFDQLVEDLGFKTRGHDTGLPRYYTKVLSHWAEQLEFDLLIKERLTERSQEQRDKLMADMEKLGIAPADMHGEDLRRRRQKEINMSAKIRIKRGNT